MKYLLFFVTYAIIIFSKPSIAAETKVQIICKNNNDVEEFILTINRNKVWKNVFKKINKKFIIVGKVVGQKHLSFILFEDKYKYLGVDFAWHLDKNTMELKPVLLSEGTIQLKKVPKKLYCKKKL
jgi:hypothetical protein